MPFRNLMEISVTLEIFFLNRLGYKCLEEVEVLVLQKISFALQSGSPQSSLQRHPTSAATVQQPPRGQARPATALRQGLCVLQGQAPPEALELQSAWQLL